MTRGWMSLLAQAACRTGMFPSAQWYATRTGSSSAPHNVREQDGTQRATRRSSPCARRPGLATTPAPAATASMAATARPGAWTAAPCRHARAVRHVLGPHPVPSGPGVFGAWDDKAGHGSVWDWPGPGVAAPGRGRRRSSRGRVRGAAHGVLPDTPRALTSPVTAVPPVTLSRRPRCAARSEVT